MLPTVVKGIRKNKAKNKISFCPQGSLKKNDYECNASINTRGVSTCNSTHPCMFLVIFQCRGKRIIKNSSEAPGRSATSFPFRSHRLTQQQKKTCQFFLQNAQQAFTLGCLKKKPKNKTSQIFVLRGCQLLQSHVSWSWFFHQRNQISYCAISLLPYHF